jgi:Uma2 family endonuclease
MATVLPPPSANVPPSTPVSASNPPLSLYRITVEQYHQMLDRGILQDGDPIELLDGLLAKKMTKNPPHRTVVKILFKILLQLLKPGWTFCPESPVSLSRSEPEPDLVVYRGDDTDYFGRHPTPADIALVIEVSHTTLAVDRGLKKRIYAEAGLPVYWIVNLDERQIEVYTQPTSAAEESDYAACQVYRAGEAAPVVIAGETLGSVNVADILPPLAP